MTAVPFKLLWPSLLCLLLHPLPSASGESTEASALLALKSAFNNATTILPSWTNGTAPCGANQSWEGILCFHGVVSRIHLPHMNLSGTIDVNSLSQLQLLRSVSFVRNSFSGGIPDMGKLTGLKAIYLTGNRFSGSIPVEFFSNLTHLKRLWLSKNNFTGTIPSSISKAQRLMDLHLQHNSFVGNIPEVDLPEMRSLNLSNNQLVGTIPTGFQRFGEKAFMGNPGLCGPPLVDKKCDLASPPDTAVTSASDVKSGKKAIVLMVLITVVLALVAGMAVMKKKRMDEEFDNGGSVYDEAEYSSHKWKQQQQQRDPYYNMEQQRLEQSSRAGVRSASVNNSNNNNASAAELVMVNRERGLFSMPDLMKAAAEVLGSGGLGSAYKAVLGNGAAVVVKRMKEMNRVGKEEFDRAMRKMGGLRHPNVLTPLAYHFRNEEKLMVFEYVEKGSLLYLLHGDRGPHHAALNWLTRLRIIQGVAKGMAYLHQELSNCEVPHGNLKSGNVLLRDDYEPLIIDYGYMSLTSHDLATQVMFAYRSPESIRNGLVSAKSDVYCLGIIVLEVLTGKFPSQYLPNGKGGTDLVQWVNSAVLEGREAELLDPDIVGGKATVEGMMVRLLRVGAGLMEPNPDLRPDMWEAARRIEEAVEEPLTRVGSSTMARQESMGNQSSGRGGGDNFDIS